MPRNARLLAVSAASLESMSDDPSRLIAIVDADAPTLVVATLPTSLTLPLPLRIEYCARCTVLSSSRDEAPSRRCLIVVVFRLDGEAGDEYG